MLYPTTAFETEESLTPPAPSADVHRLSGRRLPVRWQLFPESDFTGQMEVHIRYPSERRTSGLSFLWNR